MEKEEDLLEPTPNIHDLFQYYNGMYFKVLSGRGWRLPARQGASARSIGAGGMHVVASHPDAPPMQPPRPCRRGAWAHAAWSGAAGA